MPATPDEDGPVWRCSADSPHTEKLGAIMAAYVIVSASTADWPMTSEWENLVAIAEALGITPGALDMRSVPLIGEWNGEREHSRAIRLNTPRDVLAWRHVHATAYHLRLALGQDAVMVLADRNTDRTESNMREVFEDTYRVSIHLPTEREVEREGLATSAQVSGEPIIPGVQNGSAWTTRFDEHGDYMVAFV